MEQPTNPILTPEPCQDRRKLAALKKTTKHLVICIPAYGGMHIQFVQCLIKTILNLQNKYIIETLIQPCNPVDRGRNMLVQDAMKKDPDYILFIDTDMGWQYEHIIRLIQVMESTKGDAVTGLYFEKEHPHFPVIREYEHGMFKKIFNAPLGQIFQIGGCGMGFCLFRPEVFKKTEYPWFRFSYERYKYKDIVLAEDLYCCRQMLHAGLKIFCDTSCVLEHLGGHVGVFEYKMFAPIREESKEDKDELMKDLSDFLEIDPEEAEALADTGHKQLLDSWQKMNPRTEKEMKKFYTENNAQLLAQAEWHFKGRRKFDIELVTQMTQITKPKKVLDFGCGIGQNALMLARKGIEVTLADYDGLPLWFAEFRFNQHDVPYKVWRIDKEPMPPEEKYDAILSFDVFEHMTKDQLKEALWKLHQLKTEKTKVKLTIAPGRTADNPWHYDMDQDSRLMLNNFVHKMLETKNLNTKEYWDELWTKEGLQTWRTYPAKFDKIVEFIKESETINTVLDIGGGVGVLARRIEEEAGKEVYLTDISSEAVILAKKANASLHINHGKFPAKRPFGKKTFDCIIMTEFIEHMTSTELEDTFEMVRDMLNDKGILIISTPNDQMDKMACAEHEQTFTQQELGDLLDVHGFKDIVVETVPYGPWEFLLARCTIFK